MLKFKHYFLSIFLSVVIFFSTMIPGTVTGYDGFSREKLLSDNASEKCKPLVTGDFIQPWLCENWTDEQWDQHMEMLSGAGITMLVMQNCASTYSGDDASLKGKYCTFYYPTEMANDKDISTDDCDVFGDVLEKCLKSAQKYGMKIWFGIGGNSQWWSGAFTQEAWRNKELEIINREADEIYNLYHEKYGNVMGGWYWFHEMYVAKEEQYEIYWSDMINGCLSHLSDLDDSLPIMFSPFISTYENVCVKRTFECWSYLFENTDFRKGDIFCPQDGFGTVSDKIGIKTVEKLAYAVKLASQCNSNVTLWFNVENFTDNYGSASIGRFADQLKIDSKFASRLISFSFSHYYNGLNSLKTYYDQYIKYMNTVK